jgi:ribosomal protein S18 acetylase RimI-like enzyme
MNEGAIFAVRRAAATDGEQLARLIAGFRVALAALKGRAEEPDAGKAVQELTGYLDAGYPIYVAALDSGKLVGYLVCRVVDDVVWAESLYVDPAHRRQGIASALYARAEALAEARGTETVYNWVHPNNHAIIAFLRKRGYTVLNLVEVRRPYAKEHASLTIKVGEHEFDY